MVARRAISAQEREESIATVLIAVADGESVVKTCETIAPDRSTIMRWIRDDEELWAKYEHAREAGADMHAERLLDIAEKIVNGDLEANAGRAAADILKWTASKLKPKTYGDRVEQHFTGGTSLLDAFAALGNRGLPGDKAKVINGSATELPPVALPEPEKAA